MKGEMCIRAWAQNEMTSHDVALRMRRNTKGLVVTWQQLHYAPALHTYTAQHEIASRQMAIVALRTYK
jgi:hypothetical protein